MASVVSEHHKTAIRHPLQPSRLSPSQADGRQPETPFATLLENEPRAPEPRSSRESMPARRAERKSDTLTRDRRDEQVAAAKDNAPAGTAKTAENPKDASATDDLKASDVAPTDETEGDVGRSGTGTEIAKALEPVAAAIEASIQAAVRPSDPEASLLADDVVLDESPAELAGNNPPAEPDAIEPPPALPLNAHGPEEKSAEGGKKADGRAAGPSPEAPGDRELVKADKEFKDHNGRTADQERTPEEPRSTRSSAPSKDPLPEPTPRPLEIAPTKTSMDAPLAPTLANQVSAANAATPLASSQAAAVPVAGLAVEIAFQARAGKNRFEIRLDPPELGRIDVRLDLDRHGHVTSRLIVERAETLDLLRRDAPQLERALEQAGLKTSDNGLQFSLRGQSQGQTEQNDEVRRAQAVIPDGEIPTGESLQRSYGRLLGFGRGVDIRI